MAWFDRRVIAIAATAWLGMSFGACADSSSGAHTPDAGNPSSTEPTKDAGGSDGAASSTTFTVGGSVQGLAAGVQATLRLNDGASLLVSNGPFTFAERVAAGASYRVDAAAPTGFVCAVSNDTGTVSGNVVDVRVTCVASDATLSALAPSVGTLSPAFDPAVTSYTLVGAPKGSTAVSGGGVAFSLRATPTTSGASLRLDGAPLGAGVASEPRVLTAGASAISIEVTAPDGSTVQTYALQIHAPASIYVKASAPTNSDYFGGAVALTSDTLVAGSAQHDDSRGFVEVFRHDGDVWTHEQQLHASNEHFNWYFGASVAISGDTLVVGAPYESNGAVGVDGNQDDASVDNAGAAYVFVRTGNVWTQQAYLKASNTRAMAQFGGSVAIDGDTIVVGSVKESSAAVGVNGNQSSTSAAGAGAAYVFTRTNGVWSQQAYLKASNTRAGAAFGTCAIRGNTIAVGSVGESSNGTAQSNQSDFNAGAVYVFTRAGSTWSQQAWLKASDTREGTYLGWNVALLGDDLAVNGALGSYVFTRSGASWSEQAKLPVVPYGGVALRPDEVIVGRETEASCAPGVNGDSTDISCPIAGAAYVFRRSGAVWTQKAYLKSSLPRANAYFGAAVAAAPGWLAVGASLDSSNANGIGGDETDASLTAAGAVYLF